MGIVNETLIRVISWTLIHSLWQGFILAIVAGLIIITTKKSTAALRYNLLSIIFIGFLLILVGTFWMQLQTEFIVISENQPQDLASLFSKKASQPAISSSIDIITVVIDFLNKNVNSIALIWFVIFCMKCFQIFTNVGYIYRIRNYRTSQANPFWNTRMLELARLIQLKTPIILLESQLVTVPSVTGFFKPIILVPIGLLSNLSQDQVEAILLHELAHIKRQDYLMNILQSTAEMVFFFNPGLLWVSTLIKEERENCCDDIAIAVIDNKKEFINALVSFQEFNFSQNQLMMGFGSQKNSLLNRVKRIVYNDNATLNSIEKTFLSFCFVVVCSFVLWNSHAQKTETYKTIAAPGKTRQVIYKVKIMGDQNSLLQEEINKFKLPDLKVDKDTKQAKIDSDQANIDSEVAKQDSKISNLDSKQSFQESKNEASTIKALQSKIDKLEMQLKKLKSNTSTTKSKTTTQTSFEKIVTDDTNGKVKTITGITGEKLPDNFDDVKLTDGIIHELIKNNIIKNTKNLSFKLSANELIVNGNSVNNPESLHQRFKQKYITSKGMSICYNFKLKI